MEREDQLQQLKETILAIMCEIDKLCSEHDIRYIIVGGTALGAVRHKGFIPWDDDLDIAMPREDYDRFIELSKEYFPKDLYLRDFSNDESYYLPFGKVCKKGTKYVTELDSELTDSNEVFVDIFPLDNAESPTSGILALQAKIVKGLKAVIIRKKKMQLQSTSLSVRILQVLLAPFSAAQLMKWQKQV